MTRSEYLERVAGVKLEQRADRTGISYGVSVQGETVWTPRPRDDDALDDFGNYLNRLANG